MLMDTEAGTGFMHESFHKDNPAKFTRAWFAWQNTLFGELITKTGERGQARLAEQHTVKKHLSPLDSVDECNNQPLQGEYYHSSLPSSSGK